MRRHQDLWVVCGAAIVVVAITAVLAYVDLPWQSHIGTATQNAGHVVAIGWVAVLIISVILTLAMGGAGALTGGGS